MKPKQLTTQVQRRITEREARKITRKFTKIACDFETTLFDQPVKPPLDT